MKRVGRHAIRTLMAFLVGASWAAQAGPITLNASGEGWCTNTGFCNNTDTTAIANTFAGSNPASPGTPSALIYRDWFAFSIPVLGEISSASISIWNEEANLNTVNPAAVFNLYHAVDLSFAGLTNGPSLGSVGVNDANDGSSRYISINLNATGILSLNSAQGGLLILGGNNDNGEQIFGSTNGTPIAYLTLDANPIPEPASILLIALGFGALIGRASLGVSCLR